MTSSTFLKRSLALCFRGPESRHGSFLQMKGRERQKISFLEDMTNIPLTTVVLRSEQHWAGMRQTFLLMADCVMVVEQLSRW
jgi:hypothetical protein